ncbi:MAG: flippase-like domain-containing protein [Gemmatimonadota bacterium]|nr:flippase-like domain-containing protein [Gemmatimonadota bacterium]
MNKTALKIVISVAVLAVLLFSLPLDELWGAMRRLPPLVWLGVLGGFLGGHSLGVFKWRRMLGVGRADLVPRDAVRCYSAGLFANLCLPSIVGGDVLRAVLAGRATGRPEAVVVGSIGDRLCDTLALAGLAGVGALLVRTSLPGWWPNVIGVLLIVGVIAAGLFVPLALRRPLDSWPRKVRRPVGRTLVALRKLSRSPGAAVSVLLMSLTIQTSFVLLNAWLGRSVGVDVPLEVWFFAWPMAKIAGLLPVSLGGLGVRDATLGAALLPFSVAMATGVAVSLLWQTVLIAGGLIAGAAWALLGRGEASIEMLRRPGLDGGSAS